MKVKLVITDLDGTAVDSPSQKDASEELASAVNAAHVGGISVCVATGRPYSYAMPLLTGMGLKDPAIIAGGSRIIDPVSGNQLWGSDIPPGALLQVIGMVKPLGIKVLWNDYIEQDYTEGGWDIEGLKNTEAIHFFQLCYIPNEAAQDLRKRLDKIEGITPVLVVAQREGTNDIHIMNKDATKEHAIYELQKLLGVSKAETAGVGDGHNDFHIFNAVGHKVAMGNAVEDLKAQADKIIGDVKDDGLAKFIQEIVENEGKI